MTIKIKHQGSLWDPEARVLVHDLTCVSSCHRNELTIFLCLFINIKTTMLPSFSFAEDDLAEWQCKSRVGPRDGALRLGLSREV